MHLQKCWCLGIASVALPTFAAAAGEKKWRFKNWAGSLQRHGALGFIAWRWLKKKIRNCQQFVASDACASTFAESRDAGGWTGVCNAGRGPLSLGSLHRPALLTKFNKQVREYTDLVELFFNAVTWSLFVEPSKDPSEWSFDHEQQLISEGYLNARWSWRSLSNTTNRRNLTNLWIDLSDQMFSRTSSFSQSIY